METESEKIEEQENKARKLVEGEKKKTMEMWERAMEKLNVTKKRYGETEKSEGKRRKKQDDQGEKQQSYEIKGRDCVQSEGERTIQERKEEKEAQRT